MFRGTVIGDRNIGDETTNALAEKVEEVGRISWFRRHGVADGDAEASPASQHGRGPGVASVMSRRLDHAGRIARGRGWPAIRPTCSSTRLGHSAPFDFHRAAELIEVGHETVRRAIRRRHHRA